MYEIVYSMNNIDNMINIKNARLYCYEDISLIENYDKAIIDKTQTWVVHHRVELIMNCGQKMLKDKECFYDRPAHELIFLTRKEHARIHAIGNTNTLGKPSKQKGKHLSNDIKKKISLTLTGRKCPEHSEIMQKKRWFNNGVTSVMCEECPEGYVAGRGSCFNRA